MVNGKTLEDELRYIDDFFDSMDSKEFEEMLIECGATTSDSCEVTDYSIEYESFLNTATKYVSLSSQYVNQSYNGRFDITYTGQASILGAA